MEDDVRTQFSFLPFAGLSLQQLYDIMALRQRVFVVEQNCPYLDADSHDLNAWHLLARNMEGRLIGYARLLPKGVIYEDYPAIGRVASHPDSRGQGIGRQVMARILNEAANKFGHMPIKISAQSYLVPFYKSFGFTCEGEEYLEDNIPHIAMIRHLVAPYSQS